MSYPVICVPFLPYAAMAFFPFILVQNRAIANDQVFIRHETIHLRQQLELLIIPFYLFYLASYLINFIRFKTHDLAYRNIIFEKEAYLHEGDPAYLKNRRWWAWFGK
jgi:hypothetical protein